MKFVGALAASDQTLCMWRWFYESRPEWNQDGRE